MAGARPSGDSASPASRRREPRPAKPVTRAYLLNAAQSYLQRYASSRANLQRILTRKARLRGQETYFSDATPALIAEVLDELERLALLDDAAFAAGRAGTLQRKGASRRHAQMSLAAKGVDPALAASAVEALGLSDREQALVAARRLRVGPWRRLGPDHVLTPQELARLCRRGFSPSVIRAALAEHAQDPDRGF